MEYFEWPTSEVVGETRKEHEYTCSPSLEYIKKVWCNHSISKWFRTIHLICHCFYASLRTGHQAIMEGRTQPIQYLTIGCSGIRWPPKPYLRVRVHSLLINYQNRKVPHPFSRAICRTNPSDLIQFDYIELGVSHTGDKSALILRDGHST